MLVEKIQKIRITDKTLENITGKYQKELEDIKKLKQEILNQARSEAEEIVKTANKKVENTIRTIKESQAAKEKNNTARKQLQDIMSALAERKEKEQSNKDGYIEEKLRQVEERQKRRMMRKANRASEAEKKKMAEEAEREKKISDFRNGPLKVGEKVRIKSNGMVGEVTIVSDKAVTVIVGNIKSKMPLDRVERISSNEYRDAVKAERKPVYNITQDASITERKLNFKMEIDVRGQRVNEAIDNVMRYVDDAIMVNVSSVRIIHGKGTGALRDEIQKMLRVTPGIVSVKDESLQLGGTGVTVVTFDN